MVPQAAKPRSNNREKSLKLRFSYDPLIVRVGFRLIDTIVAQFEAKDILPGTNWDSTTTTFGLVSRHRYFTTESTVRLTLQRNRDGRVRMRVEASLPKFLQGHNITIINAAQIREACALLEREVRNLAPLVTVPAVAEWTLTEVHWCYAWRLDSPSTIISTLADIAPHSRAHRITREDDGHGGYTYRRQPRSGRGEWSEQLYDKAAETAFLLQKGRMDIERCELSSEQVTELARGVLRFEVISRRKAPSDHFGHCANDSFASELHRQPRHEVYC